MSYQNLSQPGARMFRLLSLHPGPDITAAAAASLAALTSAAARTLVTELADANLISENAPGRYAFHDLLRRYAADLAAATDTEAERREATHRMLDHYLHTACAGTRVLSPARRTARPACAKATAAGIRAEHGSATESRESVAATDVRPRFSMTLGRAANVAGLINGEEAIPMLSPHICAALALARQETLLAEAETARRAQQARSHRRRDGAGTARRSLLRRRLAG